MAVEDKYSNTDLTNKNFAVPGTGGTKAISFRGVATVAAADDDGSKYRLFRVPATFRPTRCIIATTAITGGTDYDLGIYDTQAQGGAVIDRDNLMDGQTMASATRSIDGLSNVALADLGAGKSIGELCGLTQAQAIQKGEVDVVLTANTVGSAAGTIVVELLGYAA